jgi:hypothetical protein
LLLNWPRSTNFFLLCDLLNFFAWEKIKKTQYNKNFKKLKKQKLCMYLRTVSHKVTQVWNPDLGKFWRLLQWKMLVYYISVWYILRLFGILCGHLVYFKAKAIWYIVWSFGIFYGILCGHLVCRYGMYILWLFGIFSPVLVCCTEKNLATLKAPKYVRIKLN